MTAQAPLGELPSLFVSWASSCSRIEDMSSEIARMVTHVDFCPSAYQALSWSFLGWPEEPNDESISATRLAAPVAACAGPVAEHDVPVAEGFHAPGLAVEVAPRPC